MTHRGRGPKETIEWYKRMVEAYETTLSEAEKADLEAWEQQNLAGQSTATSDWPGWKTHIGSPPWKQAQ